MSSEDKCFIRGIYCEAVAFLCYVQCAASAMRAQDYAGYAALASILIAIIFGLAGVILSALGSKHVAYAAHESTKQKQCPEDFRALPRLRSYAAGYKGWRPGLLSRPQKLTDGTASGVADNHCRESPQNHCILCKENAQGGACVSAHPGN